MSNEDKLSTGVPYKGRMSMWLYIFHRVTGVALFGYLLIHIISTTLILLGPEVYEGAEAVYKNFYFRIAEIFLMLAVLAHAVNGLRIIAIDLWSKGTKYQSQLNYLAVTIFFVVWIPASIKMINSYFDICIEKSSEGTTIVDCMIRPIPDWITNE